MLGIQWKVWLSTSVTAASLNISRRTCHATSVLHSTWLLCWVSQLNWASNAPFSASLHESAVLSFPAKRSENLCYSTPAGASPPSPVNLMNILTGMAQKSRLSLSSGLIFFYKTKQKRLASSVLAVIQYPSF